jgi:hypothetical protein
MVPRKRSNALAVKFFGERSIQQIRSKTSFYMKEWNPVIKAGKCGGKTGRCISVT